jgi:subtilisin family serine protease
VVNLSLGGHLDGHDGNDEPSLEVDRLSGPDRIVCCAAGNEGQDAIHASITMAQGDTAEITFEISAARELVVLNGWYSGQDEIDVAVEDPNGLRTAFQQPIVGSQQLQRYAVGAAIVQAVTPSAAGSHSDRHFHIQLSRRGGLPQGTWKLLLSARVARVGIIDVWSTDDHGDAGAPFTSHVDDRMKVGSPGCARSAITVGNYASRLRYTADTGFSVKGRSFVFPNQVVPGSSRGPTRDNRPKPEILAPGAVVISALSSQSQISPDLRVSGTFRAMEGTSMSCAVVSGLAARLLETEPNLTPDDFKRRLIRSVQSGVGAPPKSNPQEDAGLIDAGRL